MTDRHDVRPAAWRFGLLVLGLIAFVALGVWLVTNGDLFTVPLGLLTIAFFGGYGGYGLYRMRQGMARIAILPSGIEIAMFSPKARLIPWRDIEAIGVLSIANQEMTSVRLNSYQALLEGLTDDEARLVLRHFQAMRLMTRATVVVGAMHFADVSGLKEFVSGSEHVKSVVEMLRYTRHTFGAELLLPWNMRDRSAREFADYLEARRATAARTPA